MRRAVRYILVLAILVVAVVALRLTVFKAVPIPVSVFKAARGRVEAIVVNSKAGTIRTRQRAQISPGVSGIVVELPVRKGQRVTAGQLLLRLDDAEYQAQVDVGARALAAATVAEREATLQVDQAGRDLARQKPLAQEGAISASSLEQVQHRLDIAQASRASARERIKQAQASLDVARTALEKTRVFAPFSGVIADIRTERGEWLSPSPPGVKIPAVIDLFDPDSIYVSAPLDEVDLAKIALNLPVRITIDAFPDSAFPGRVTRVAPYVSDLQEQNRTFEIEVSFESVAEASVILPGATADVEVILEARPDVLRIPTYAVLEGSKVLVVQDGILVLRTIRVGLKNWEFAEVLDGLSPGDAIVVSLDRAEVKEGAVVTVTDETLK